MAGRKKKRTEEEERIFLERFWEQVRQNIERNKKIMEAMENR